MLKHDFDVFDQGGRAQPPSGGCVLKLTEQRQSGQTLDPAAFRRLCVETICVYAAVKLGSQPPSGGCVLKQNDDY